jgi:dUTP pyrophosphatase
MKLYIYAEDPVLRNMYRDSVANRRRTDSGLDLFNPEMTLEIPPRGYSIPINLKVKVGAVDTTGRQIPCLLVPRSSLSNTPLRLANSIGLIDMGYRGNVIAKVDCLDNVSAFEVQQGTRYFQLVAPDWLPWTQVFVVDSPEQLPPSPDDRGAGGFGSTGR